jgi:hypothetical protein
MKCTNEQTEIAEGRSGDVVKLNSQVVDPHSFLILLSSQNETLLVFACLLGSRIIKEEKRYYKAAHTHTHFTLDLSYLVATHITNY